MSSTNFSILSFFRSIQKIILTNDLTEKVLHEAVEKKSDLIISYHPPIFSGLKSITQKSWKTRLVSVCLENRIALYSPHTSWDNLHGAIGDWLLRALPHAEAKIISPSVENSEFGCGRSANVDSSTPITLTDAIERVKKHTGIKTVQVGIGVNNSLTSEIRSFAVCPGSGSSVLRGVHADLYITGISSFSFLF